MPFYQVYHSTPLDNLQRDALAKAITNAHSGTTGALKIFVNIDFHHNTNPYQYVGGIRRPNNKIIGLLRPRGDVIGEELMKDIMKEIQEAWNEIVGSEGEQELSVIWLNDSLKTGMEFGILLPKAFEDHEWFQANKGEFEKRAAQGDQLFIDAIKDNVIPR